MTTYTKITIGGNIIDDTDACHIQKALGKIHSSSKFDMLFDNDAGEIGSKFTVGDEVIIWSDIDINPPTTKIFTGILENINHRGNALKERIKIDGRDYSARLMDRTVEPEVYTGLSAGSIIEDIITKYVDDITINNVDTGTTIDRIVFNQLPVYDAIKQLADLSNFTFFVDEDKDLHFKEPGTTSSNQTFSSGNILKADFKQRRDTIYNQVWVYGDRYLDGFQETFTGDAGSTYTLLYKPHNTSVTIDGTIMQPGFIANMISVAGSDIKYLVGYEDKKIIFTSGTDQGDNINIGSPVVITYDRALPIVKVGDNDDSQGTYGVRVKVIQDKNIKDPLTAQAIMLSELEEFSDPLKQGELSVKGVTNLTPGNTCIVDIPFHNVNNKTYEILGVQYNFTRKNMLNDTVMSIDVNKKLPDITDTLKNVMLELKKLQGADINTSDFLTRYKLSAGSFSLRMSGATLWSREIGESFILGHPVNGLLGSYATHSLGDTRTGSTIQWSGGYF